MEKITLTAQVRENAGKGIARGLRREAKVPAVLYSHGDSLPIATGAKEMSAILNSAGGKQGLITLTLEGEGESGERMALVKDYQLDPITGKLLHIDFMEVAMNEKVRVQIPVHLTGTAAGIKEGGILQYGVHNIEVECLPGQIPGSVEVDITGVTVNSSLHVRDIKAPEGVRVLTDPDATIITIQPPVSAAKLESMLTGGAAPAAEGEPEVVKKPKKEEAAAAAAPKKEVGKK